MKLQGEQLVLDTNILVHLLRGQAAGQAIDRVYRIAERLPRAVISMVVKGELKAFAFKAAWGDAQHRRLDEMLAALPALDISSPRIIAAYAQLDAVSEGEGRTMGKNDLWIAATTQVIEGVLLTTDADFDHLNPAHVRVERLDVDALKLGKALTVARAPLVGSDEDRPD